MTSRLSNRGSKINNRFPLPVFTSTSFEGMTYWGAGMIEGICGFDESNPYILVDRRDACPTFILYKKRLYGFVDVYLKVFRIEFL